MELNFKKKKNEDVTPKETSSPKNDFDKYSKHGKYNSTNHEYDVSSNNDLIDSNFEKEKIEKIDFIDNDEFNKKEISYQRKESSSIEDDDLDKYFNDYINVKQEDKKEKKGIKRQKKESENSSNLLNNILISVIGVLIVFIVFILLIERKNYTLTIINDKKILNVLTCKSYKFFSYESGCKVTLPSLTEKGKYDLGYSIDENLTIENKPNDVIELKESKALFAIIGEKIVTVNFVATEAEYIEYDKAQCLIPKGKKSCEIKIPYIDKEGEYRLTFNSQKNKTINSYKDTSGLYFLDKTYKFSKDTTLYETIEAFAERNISLYKKYKVKNSYIEIDNACTDQQKSQIVSFLSDVEKNSPFLLNIKGKITFLSHNNFYQTWIMNNVGATGAVGITTMAKNLNTARIANIDIDCQYVNTAAVHEMVHRYDYNYALSKGNYLSSKDDLVDLYRKYSINFMYYRYPFRQYAYTNQKEFLAEAYNYYYFTYKNYNASYSQYNYPEDIKAFVEKNIK